MREIEVEHWLRRRLENWVDWNWKRENKKDWHCRSIEHRYHPGYVWDGKKRRSYIPINEIEAFETERAIEKLKDAHWRFPQLIRLQFYFTWVPPKGKFAILGCSKATYHRMLQKALDILEKKLAS